ncbi:MAG: dsbD [Capsulimonas sp.]|jgi:thiol:disulfide interchange protein DsbD|nr:dsbD [Capsulimonas sp.]
MIRRSFAAAAALLITAAIPALAQMPGANVAKVSTTAKPAAVKHGGKGVLAITVNVAPGFHINANKPNDPDLIPTVFTAENTPGVKFGAPKYPATKSITVSYEKKPMLVYQGKAVILIPYTIAPTAKPGKVVLKGTLGFQGCNDSSCFPPDSAPVSASVTVK